MVNHIELFDCPPLSARISERQCLINQGRALTEKKQGWGTIYTSNCIDCLTGKEIIKNNGGSLKKVAPMDSGGKKLAKGNANKKGRPKMEEVSITVPGERVKFYLDFTDYPEILAFLEERAKINFRSVPQEIMCRLANGKKIFDKGKPRQFKRAVPPDPSCVEPTD